ncbi:hypothetical protein M2158_006761 [Streptomyces sp. SAI-144]|uniref:hypothetical protein n=1 Tax=Streptomyces sp. SAI-144 TaxID=2940544 RepID=UPI00247CF581|nr:hypothetical protein [Streptomyces sp. SAI-144]
MQEQGRDRIDAPPVITSEPTPDFPERKQDPPGLESDMDPRPRYRAERYRAAGKLTGKVALITGGDSGIGRDETRQVVEEQGRRCLLLPGDLCEPEFCRDVVERTVRELGRLNILVSNAAYLTPTPTSTWSWPPFRTWTRVTRSSPRPRRKPSRAVPP